MLFEKLTNIYVNRMYLLHIFMECEKKFETVLLIEFHIPFPEIEMRTRST